MKRERLKLPAVGLEGETASEWCRPDEEGRGEDWMGRERVVWVRDLNWASLYCEPSWVWGTDWSVESKSRVRDSFRDSRSSFWSWSMMVRLSGETLTS